MTSRNVMQQVEPAAVCEALGLDVARVEGKVRARCPHPDHDDMNPSLRFWEMETTGKEGFLAVWCPPCETAGWCFGGSSAGRDDVAGLVTFVMHQRGHDGWLFQDSLNFLGKLVGETGGASSGRARRSSPPGIGPEAADVVARSQQDVDRTVRGWSAFWSWKGVDLTEPEIRWLVERWRLGIFTKGAHNGPEFPDRALAMPNYAGAGGGEAGVMFWSISRRALDAEWFGGGPAAPLTTEQEFLGEWASETWHVTGSRISHLYGEWRDSGAGRVILTEGQTDTLAVAVWTHDDDVDVLGLMGSGAARNDGTVALLAGREVTLLMDSDPSGDAAATFWTSRLADISSVAVATLPDRDLDACKAGREVVLEALRSARPA